VLTAGQRHESVVFPDVMDAVAVPRPRGWPRKRPVAGDRAYDAAWIRRWCRDRGIESVIPARPRTGPGRPPTCDDGKYARRNTIERLVGRLKERRRLGARCEEKATHYGEGNPLQGHAPLDVRTGAPESIIARRSAVSSRCSIPGGSAAYTSGITRQHSESRAIQ
jgi:transposase